LISVTRARGGWLRPASTKPSPPTPSSPLTSRN
jgi:hypothetical protein